MTSEIEEADREWRQAYDDARLASQVVEHETGVRHVDWDWDEDGATVRFEVPLDVARRFYKHRAWQDFFDALEDYDSAMRSVLSAESAPFGWSDDPHNNVCLD